jgi:hypothetical protein
LERILEISINITGDNTMPKNNQRKIYKSMQGKQVDMDLLRQRNELTPAVGNVRVNARGDELGPGGKIVKKREELISSHHTTNKPVPDEIPAKKESNAHNQEKDLVDDWQEPEPTTEWVEDENGNFVRKEGE